MEVSRKKCGSSIPPAGIRRRNGERPGKDPVKAKILLLLMPFPVAGAWGTVAPVLREAILHERLEAVEGEGWRALLEEASDAEVASLLSSASLEAPLSHEATQVYLWAATRVVGSLGVEVPEDIRVETLALNEEYLLRDLRRRIRRSLLKTAEERLKALLKGVPGRRGRRPWKASWKVLLPGPKRKPWQRRGWREVASS